MVSICCFLKLLDEGCPCPAVFCAPALLCVMAELLAWFSMSCVFLGFLCNSLVPFFHCSWHPIALDFTTAFCFLLSEPPVPLPLHLMHLCPSLGFYCEWASLGPIPYWVSVKFRVACCVFSHWIPCVCSDKILIMKYIFFVPAFDM